MNTIQHKAVFVQDHEGSLHRVAGENADILVNGSEPFSSDLERVAVGRIKKQDVIEVTAGRRTVRWEGTYQNLVVRNV